MHYFNDLNYLNYLAIILGLCFGSFYNVIIYRLPKEKSIIFPRSHCLNCSAHIPFYLNVPLISYILLRGKCKFCGNKISLQYPIVEIITGILWFWSFNNYNLEDGLLFLLISGILTIIAFIDLNNFIIPTSLIVSSFLGLLLYYINYTNKLENALLGLLFGVLYLGSTAIITSYLSKKQTLGFGDILLISILGLWLGYINVCITIFFSSMLALIFWIIISIKTEFDSNRPLPFGFYLSLSGIIIYMLDINPLIFLP